MEIVRLRAEDYDALLAFYNMVFTRENRRPMDFTKELPRMWGRDDEHMSKHLAIKENGEIRAAVGVYPLYTDILGERLLFSTVGNVATHPDSEGRGYMRALMECAMKELGRLGADASRLGGLRQRYHHYGYEFCGQVVHFTFTGRNRRLCCPGVGEGISFREVGVTDEAALRQIVEWDKRQGIRVLYEGEEALRDVGLSLQSWNNHVFLARDAAGRSVGYLCAPPAGGTLARIGAPDEQALLQTICAWQKFVDKTVEFTLAPYQVGALRLFSGICENYSIGSPSLFRIMNWQKVILALLRLKFSYAPLPHGELVLDIEGYGKLRLSVGESGCACEKTDAEAEVHLTPSSAARCLFGPLPADCFGLKNPAAAWFPLPLYWDMQDRV